MKALISVYLWTIGLLYFGLLCIIVIILSLFLPPATYDPIIKKMLRGFFRLLHTRVTMEGAEKKEGFFPHDSNWLL